MVNDPIPAETREQLKEDLEITINRIEAIKSGQSPNFRVLDQYYTTPLVSETEVVALSDDRGEYAHYKELGHMVLNILMQGRVPPKFKPRLETFRAPRYVMRLAEESV